MNFLAHLFLSGSDEELMVGNFIADVVKGKTYNNYPTQIAKGIVLHRHIDDFTDKHPLIRHSASFFKPTHRLFAYPIVDILNGHFLVKYWTDYATISLVDYQQELIRILTKHKSMFPHPIGLFAEHIVFTNRFFDYEHSAGLARVLLGMSRRTKTGFDAPLVMPIFEQNYEVLESNFQTFFPQLQAMVSERLAN